jgi:hypothetical protein
MKTAIAASIMKMMLMIITSAPRGLEVDIVDISEVVDYRLPRMLARTGYCFRRSAEV